MQHHTVQQIDRGPRTGKWIYTGGNDRMGRYAECCADAWLAMLETPVEERDTSPVWDRIGHETAPEAYAHMRAVLLGKLRLDGELADWSGCRAPVAGGHCDTPTKSLATIPPIHFSEPLCDEHRTREMAEAMWQGPATGLGPGEVTSERRTAGRPGARRAHDLGDRARPRRPAAAER